MESPARTHAMCRRSRLARAARGNVADSRGSSEWSQCTDIGTPQSEDGAAMTMPRAVAPVSRPSTTCTPP
eukprot:725569-Prymnesium_polylepis.1